jgi:hypothetical protein
MDKLQQIKGALEACKERLDYLEEQGLCKNINTKILIPKALTLIDKLIDEDNKLQAESKRLREALEAYHVNFKNMILTPNDELIPVRKQAEQALQEDK